MKRHPAFRGRPTLGQFAKGGAWETAWAFAPAAAPSPVQVDAWLAGAGEVAFEAFFGDAFFGLRLRGEAARVAAGSRACVAALRDAVDGPGFFDGLADGLGLDDFGHAPDYAEVGAVNAWRSVGGFRIDRIADLVDDFDRTRRALAASPVGREAAHPKAIEFACEHPLPHWFALPLGRPGAPFAIDDERLRRAAEGCLAGR